MAAPISIGLDTSTLDREKKLLFFISLVSRLGWQGVLICVVRA
jgi:hypothetical protein